MLDMEYMMATAQNAKTIFWEKFTNTSNLISNVANFAYTFDQWLVDISSDLKGVEVFSISYV